MQERYRTTEPVAIMRNASIDLETISSVSRERKFLAIDRTALSLLLAASYFSVRFNGDRNAISEEFFPVKGMENSRRLRI